MTVTRVAALLLRSAIGTDLSSPCGSRQGSSKPRKAQASHDLMAHRARGGEGGEASGAGLVQCGGQKQVRGEGIKECKKVRGK